jgi:hypothetical protein
MMKWRSATGELVAEVADLLDDPSPELRAAALHLLAAAGQASRPFADRIAASITQPSDQVATLAVWALARLADARAVPHVNRALRRSPELFTVVRTYYSMPYYALTQLPGLADVLAPLAPYAEHLMPAIRWRLRDDRSTPTIHTITEILAAYGPSAVAAIPELTSLLDTADCELACNVIGVLGHQNSEVERRLKRVIRRGGDVDRSAAAWALFRITGNPDPCLKIFGLLVDAGRVADIGRRLADLGPLAVHHADQVANALHERRGCWQAWDCVELARAHWRLTGDPELCLDVFDAALDPLRHGRQPPLTHQALRYLPELGHAGRRFSSLLQTVVAQDERLIYNGGWRGIAEDDQVHSLASAGVQAATGPMPHRQSTGRPR